MVTVLADTARGAEGDVATHEVDLWGTAEAEKVLVATAVAVVATAWKAEVAVEAIPVGVRTAEAAKVQAALGTVAAD